MRGRVFAGRVTKAEVNATQYLEQNKMKQKSCSKERASEGMTRTNTRAVNHFTVGKITNKKH